MTATITSSVRRVARLIGRVRAGRRQPRESSSSLWQDLSGVPYVLTPEDSNARQELTRLFGRGLRFLLARRVLGSDVEHEFARVIDASVAEIRCASAPLPFECLVKLVYREFNRTVRRTSVERASIPKATAQESFNIFCQEASPDERTILQLRYCDRLTIEETAGRSGIDSERVRAILREARERFRKQSRDKTFNGEHIQ